MKKVIAEEIRQEPDTREEEPDFLTREEELSLKRVIIEEYTGHSSVIDNCLVILQYDSEQGYKEVFNGCPTNISYLPEGLHINIGTEPMPRELLEEIVEGKFYDLFVEEEI